MSRLLQCYDAGNGAQLLWIEAQDYAAQLLCGGTPPWTDAASALAYLNNVQGLIRSDVIVLPVATIIAAWLDHHADLRVAIATKTRLLSPLKVLLGDAALRTHLNQIAQGLRASHRERPLVLSVPSPRHWPALAYAQAFVDAISPVVEADDADAASVYIADFLRGFGEIDIDGLLLHESTDSVPASDEDLACYGAVANLARHYRWALVLQQPRAGDYDAATIDLVLTPQPQRGAVRDMRSATLDATSVPVGRHLLIPAHGLSPERVLESLAALRHDGVTC